MRGPSLLVYALVWYFDFRKFMTPGNSEAISISRHHVRVFLEHPLETDVQGAITLRVCLQIPARHTDPYRVRQNYPHFQIFKNVTVLIAIRRRDWGNDKTFQNMPSLFIYQLFSKLIDIWQMTKLCLLNTYII